MQERERGREEGKGKRRRREGKGEALPFQARKANPTAHQTFAGVLGRLREEAARRSHSSETCNASVPPDAQQGPGWFQKTQGWSRGMPMWIPRAQGKLQGREKLLSTPTPPSAHSFFC